MVARWDLKNQILVSQMKIDETESKQYQTLFIHQLKNVQSRNYFTSLVFLSIFKTLIRVQHFYAGQTVCI
jgi:hypothetical protein